MKKILVAFVVFLCYLGAFFYLRQPDVSVIVPVYNSEQYLRECLDSLKKQTLQNIEFIVINDGSVDRSFKIMQSYAKDDARFRIFTQENKGVGATRNRALTLAKGKYIGFVDSDDYVSPNYFEKLYEVAKEHDADVSISHRIVWFYKDQAEDFIPYPKFKIIDDFSSFVGNFGQQWDKIYKKSFLEKNNIKSLENRFWFEDEWFSTLVALYAQKIVMTDETTYYYRYNPKGLSNGFDKTREGFLKGLEIYGKLLNIIDDAGFSEERTVRLKQKMQDRIEKFKDEIGQDFE